MKTPEGKPREVVDAGLYPFKLVHIYDLGTQQPNNPTFSAARKVYIEYELLGARKENGDAHLIGQEYTFSKKSKNLAAHFKGWGKDHTDLQRALGAEGMMQVVQNESNKTPGEMYANIMTLMPAGKNKAPKAQTALNEFYLDEDEPFDKDTFDKLPEWLRKKIAASPEYTRLVSVVEKKKVKGKK